MKDFQMKEMGDLLSEIIVECQDLCEDIGCVLLVVTQLCLVTLVQQGCFGGLGLVA